MTDWTKSRLAEILCVDDDEVWTVETEDYKKEYRIHNGKREYRYNKSGWAECYAEAELTYIINHPEKIRLVSRFTEQDVADAKAIIRVYPWANSIIRYPRELQVRAEIADGRITDIPVEMFPTVDIGQSYKLSQILDG